MSALIKSYLTDEQVFSLNQKHGWFEFGDAQSDVSRAFANDAIAMYERVRAAAPDLLEALKELLATYAEPNQAICCDGRECGCMGASVYQQAEHYARAAIAKATGEQP